MIVEPDKLKLDTEYWVCDTEMACGNTRNNVFKYNPTLKENHLGKKVLVINRDYKYFTTKKEAIKLSVEIEKNY